MKPNFLLLLLFISNVAFGQIPAYYNDVNLNLTGQNLKDELSSKVTSTQINNLSYTPGVWDALKQTDLVPGNSSKIVLIYGFNDSDGTTNTDRTRGVNNNGGGTTDWNREHVYPKSLGTPNLGTSGPGADAHHLRPADVSRNSNRGSRKFADGSGNSGTTSQGHWYPGDEFKGDVARMMMYMYIRYGDRCLPKNVGVGSVTSGDSNMLDLFLDWNAEDPVSQLEIQRNPVLESLQGNRNPFIDNPALATIIWGGAQAENRFGGVIGNPGGNFCTNAINTFPYKQGFESGIGAWVQSTSDDFDWTRNSGSTASSNTGPSSASAGSYYLYMESSSPNNSADRAIVTSPCYDLNNTSQANFSFKYHMYGASNMGLLKLEASIDGNNWSEVWTKSGNQGNVWNTANVNLSAYLDETVQLRFNGVTGSTWQGDMAIDAIDLSTSGGGTGGIPEIPVALSITFDDYPEETSWVIRDAGNNVVKSGGTYASQPDGSTLVINTTLDAGCYQLVFSDSYGDGICCSFGNGSYNLLQTANGSVLASGGSFTGTDTRNFCVNTTGTRVAVDNLNSTQTETLSLSVLDFYPNPVEDYLTVVTAKNTRYSLSSQTGQVIKKGEVVNRIYLRDIQPGIYFLTLSDGKTTLKRKLIKQ